MDSLNIQQLNIRFGEGTMWTMSVTCKWCGKYIKGQTEQRYKERGNICEKCNVEKSEPSIPSLERIKIANEIKECHESMELLGEGLDLKDITEMERQIIVLKMREYYERIRSLKSMLCEN